MPEQVIETWRSIPWLDGLYEVSDMARVRRLVRRGAHPAGILKLTQRSDGYLYAWLYTNGSGKQWLVHRLVLTVFVGPMPTEMHGAHLSGEKSDNRLSNLVWATPAENASHRKLHGTESIGERNPQAKITEKDVTAIRAQYRPWSRTHSCHAIGKRYGLSYQTVWDIVKHRHWKHVL